MSIFFIFVMGFSQGYYVLFQVFILGLFKPLIDVVFQSYESEEEDHPMPNPVESILGIFLMSLGNTLVFMVRVL